MKQIPLLQGKALLIELPEGAKMQGLQTTSPNAIVYADTHGHGVILGIPPGNWRIVGMLSELTEEQAAGIVEGGEIPFDETASAYRNYSYKSEWGAMWLSTALESLDSAIGAEGWYFENPIQTVDDNYSAIGDYYHNESRVLDRSRCLLLGRDDL